MKKMKFTFFALFFAVALANAQEQKSISKKAAFGFQLGQYQNDFGFGVNFTTGYFAGGNLAVRVRGNVMYFEHNVNYETTWTPYANLSLGLIGVGGEIGNFMRLYGEGGMLVLFPNTDFSSNNSEFGGYGLFGFEFFMHPQFNYFLEVGGAGTGATADRV